MQIIIDAGDSPATLTLARRMLDLIEGAPSPQGSLLLVEDLKLKLLVPDPGAAHDRLMEGRELPSVGTVLPPPPPVVIVPSAPPAPTGTPELDKQGLPWDERIHSSSRERVKDGTWKLKRGVADDLVASVRVESRSLFPLPHIAGQSGSVTSSLAAPLIPAAPVVPAPSGAPPPPPPPAPSAAQSTVTWIQLMSRLTDLQKAGRLDPAECNKLAVAYGVDKFQKLALHEQHWASIYETLGAYLDA